MVGYRCYILDGDDHILQAYEFDCTDDSKAESAAEDILAQDPYHLSVELWEATRRIKKFDREAGTGLRLTRRQQTGRRALTPAARYQIC